MKKNTWKIILIVIGLVLLIAGVSYAFWTYQTNQTDINVLQTNCMNIELVDDTDAINLENAYPISDEKGKNTKPYRFTIKNTCTVDITYNLNLEVLELENRMASSNIAARVDGNNIKTLPNYTSTTPTYKGADYTAIEAYTLSNGTLKGGESKTHSVRVWIDKSAGNDTQNKSFYSKVVISSSQTTLASTYKETILNGADPVLGEGLIPVNIANDGTVTKADTTKEWYNYESKQWANAVILEDESIEYGSYDIIPESNIESYFVWIPRYKYKIWDEGQYNSLTTIDESKPHTIQVEFETKDKAASTGSTIGSWLTHPAFTAFGVNGLWVGKFESGYKGATTTAEAQKNESDSTKLQIKPNAYSWRSIQPSNMHLVSYNYQRNLDSHMMKNTEWGAVAYLQHSAYGSQTSVRINNNSAYITGYAAKNEPTMGYTGTNEPENIQESTVIGVNGENTYMYNTDTGYLASTTGNITGVYDMSGGAWEYVMGIMTDQAGKPLSGRNQLYNSGFTGKFGCPTCDVANGNDETITEIKGVEWPEEKYYDLYSQGTTTLTYNNRILGDATGEMGPFASKGYLSQNRNNSSWYADDAYFVFSTYPWFIRGARAAFGTGAGVFTFFRDAGGAFGNYENALSSYGFRVVLAL